VQTVYGIWDYGDRIYYPGAWGAYSNDDDTEYLGAFNRPKNLSNFPGKDVELLEQTSTTYPVTIVNINNQTVNTDIRVLSDNTPNWYTVPDLDPLGTNGNPNLDDLAEDPLQTAHGGWFWDLPLSGERVVTDVLLRDGRLVVICFTPNPDRCSDGGSSFLMELNSFTGGTSGGTIFDINNDGRIDGDDWVKIGVDDDGNDIKAIPDGLKLEGMVQQPAILILDPEVEIKYLSSSTGAVHMVKEKAVRLGVTYWKELEK
jgi:Tfp pilus tip-associated adhesin PilY1